MAELIPPPLVTAAIEAADAAPGYLRALTRSGWLRAHCHGTGEIEAAAEAAATALRQYAAGLRQAIAPRAAGPCGCGAEHLGFLLRHRHRLAVSPEACAPLLDRLAQTLDAPLDTDAIADTTAGEGLGAECARQATLLREAGLLTLPASPLRVAGGPARPAQGMVGADSGWPHPAAAGVGVDYVPDLVRGQGTLYVAETSPRGDVPRPAAPRLCCLGLGWGGLHSLMFAGGMTARSLPRLLAGGVSLSQGWPLSLLDQIPLLDDAAVRRARRAAVAHARLDLDLHLGRLDLAGARARAAEHGDADVVLAGLIRSPGDSLAAVLGWQLIDAARRRRVADGAAAAELRRFHDGLVAHGPIPASAALAACLDHQTVSALLARICDTTDAAA
jgi:hypothetical protein